MSSKEISIPLNSDDFLIQLQIDALKSEINEVEVQLHEFEAILRNFVLDDMIEEQELAAKYRNFQKAKKAKRLEQKRRGKNYQEPKGIVVTKKTSITKSDADTKEMKRLYRDAMLKVHPDRFEQGSKEEQNATEVTAKLVSIYQSGDLKELQLYYRHITNEKVEIEADSGKGNLKGSDYLMHQKEKFENRLQKLKAKHTYVVLTTYSRPIDFAQELKDYYKDRIAKLKKRTRKV